MIVAERKSKYKTKITVADVKGDKEKEIIAWCEESFGEGGRGRKNRWRFGWIQADSTFYFKDASDATIFMLRWS